MMRFYQGLQLRLKVHPLLIVEEYHRDEEKYYNYYHYYYYYSFHCRRCLLQKMMPSSLLPRHYYHFDYEEVYVVLRLAHFSVDFLILPIPLECDHPSFSLCTSLRLHLYLCQNHHHHHRRRHPADVVLLVVLLVVVVSTFVVVGFLPAFSACRKYHWKPSPH